MTKRGPQTKYWTFTIEDANGTDAEPFTMLNWKKHFAYLIATELVHPGETKVQVKGLVVAHKVSRLTTMSRIAPRATWEPLPPGPLGMMIKFMKDTPYVERGELPSHLKITSWKEAMLATPIGRLAIRELARNANEALRRSEEGEDSTQEM